MAPVVLSHYQTRPLPRRPDAPRNVLLSPDLGLSRIEATIEPRGLLLPDGQLVTWGDLEEIDHAENNCFVIRDGRPVKVIAFSALTNRSCSLMPTSGAPTMLVAGFTMHRIVDCDPYADAAAKVKAVAPVRGCVLDTATGLGYTAIEAARSAEHVHTIELDPAAREIAGQNPWSRPLWELPNITLHLGDSAEIVGTFAGESFDRIIHDPPVVSLAGRLYSGEFYAELSRILKKNGRLFHYVGNPASRSAARTTSGVSERLRDAGFSRVRPAPRAFGLVAEK